jgi:hypothetical protein
MSKCQQDVIRFSVLIACGRTVDSNHQFASALFLGLPAGITHFAVNTDYAATSRALQSLLFASEEFIDTICLNVPQVLNHTHSVFFSIAFIKLIEPFAWKIRTFKTVIDPLISQPIARPLDNRTWRTSESTAFTRFLHLFAIHSVTEKCSADSAVHSAWRYE